MDCTCYVLGLSFRNTVKVLYFLYLVKISHVSIWNWIQKYKPKRCYSRKGNLKNTLVYKKDETAIKAGSELIWLWVIIESIYKEILSFPDIKRTKYVCVTIERILSHVVNRYWISIHVSYRRWVFGTHKHADF